MSNHHQGLVVSMFGKTLPPLSAFQTSSNLLASIERTAREIKIRSYLARRDNERRTQSNLVTRCYVLDRNTEVYGMASFGHLTPPVLLLLSLICRAKRPWPASDSATSAPDQSPRFGFRATRGQSWLTWEHAGPPFLHLKLHLSLF